MIERLPNLELDGLHAYDGHIHDRDPEARRAAARPGIEKTLRLRDRLKERGMRMERLVMGGAPTFPIHAAVELRDRENLPAPKQYGRAF